MTRIVFESKARSSFESNYVGRIVFSTWWQLLMHLILLHSATAMNTLCKSLIEKVANAVSYNIFRYISFKAYFTISEAR